MSQTAGLRGDIEALARELHDILAAKQQQFAQRLDEARSARAFLSSSAAEPGAFEDYLLANRSFMETVNALDFAAGQLSDRLSTLAGISPADIDSFLARKANPPLSAIPSLRRGIQKQAAEMLALHEQIIECMKQRSSAYAADADEIAVIRKVRGLLEQYQRWSVYSDVSKVHFFEHFGSFGQHDGAVKHELVTFSAPEPRFHGTAAIRNTCANA
jgi:hypothetical protein